MEDTLITYCDFLANQFHRQIPHVQNGNQGADALLHVENPLWEQLKSEALSLAERSSFRAYIHFCTTASARGKVMSGEKDINLNEIFKCHEENKTKIFEGYMARYIGEILLNIDDQHMNEAEEWIKKAIEADKRNGTMLELGMDHAHYAELLKRKGDLLEAKENLRKAIEIYKECGADGWLKEAEEALADFGE